MSRLVIVAYRPRHGREEELVALLREHVPALRKEGLVTEREAIVMQAADGTFVELFEWASTEATRVAHARPAVQELWARLEQVCDYTTLARLAEAQGPFAEFTPVALAG